ncbi:hypothetical protein EYF80_063058 [Liparis tanakae]|uniref:Uncharacterized protein n=1 Tax=Liparis tanakae TaxID=230148 RepID=A0A4Z2EDH6_9TELE|nr:hypothetical protein EYF80_063058 [Liparis tanakae]
MNFLMSAFHKILTSSLSSSQGNAGHIRVVPCGPRVFVRARDHLCLMWTEPLTQGAQSTVHTVSALEHPLSAVLKDVLNSTISPVRGQLGPFRISGASRSFAQNTLNWSFTNGTYWTSSSAPAAVSITTGCAWTWP